MAPEARNMFGAPMFQLHCSSFGSKFAVLEKLLATLFALFGARGIVPHLAPRCAPADASLLFTFPNQNAILQRKQSVNGIQALVHFIGCSGRTFTQERFSTDAQPGGELKHLAPRKFHNIAQQFLHLQ